MAESKSKTSEKNSKPYVPTRNAETAVGSLVHGEVIYLHDSEQVTNLVNAGYLVSQDEYLDQTDAATLLQMEREQGVSARED